MRENAQYTMREGKDEENDWVITDTEGKTVLEISRHDLWEIEEKLKMYQEQSRQPLPKGYK